MEFYLNIAEMGTLMIIGHNIRVHICKNMFLYELFVKFVSITQNQ